MMVRLVLISLFSSPSSQPIGPFSLVVGLVQEFRVTGSLVWKA